MQGIRGTGASLAAVIVCLAGAARGQVIINEVFENPPGSGTDDVWEYIELYGRPGMSLTGYAVGALKGGMDSNGDNIPNVGEDGTPEIDEAFSLDGYSIGADGFFVLYNANAFGFSSISQYLTPNPAFNPGLPDGPSNKRFLDGASFDVTHIPSTDTPGNLNHDGSSTFALVRKRKHHSINAQGQSVYAPGYAFRKDVKHDVNFDGKTDFGTETNIPQIPGPAAQVEHYQMVDDLAWSNEGGKEYVRSSQQEISDTSGFNPDAVSRLRYFCENPGLGHRTRDLPGGGFEILPTRIADESFIYGELRTSENTPGGNPVFPQSLLYCNFPDSEGWLQVKAPTDQNATPYDGSCDPEPDDAPNPACQPVPGGQFRFTDLNVAGFGLTPGSFNDHPTNPAIVQFRFVTADFNFDGAVDQTDLSLITARAGATLDDTQPAVYDNGTPDNPNDDVNYLQYVWQGCGFQQTLMMMEMDMTDGPGGTNASFITQADIDAVAALVPPEPCPGDLDGNGSIDSTDLNLVLSTFGCTGGSCAGDADGDGDTDSVDLNIILSVFGSACP